MMLYKNTQAKVRSPDGDTEIFDVLAGVLQGDTLAHFILTLDCSVLHTSVDKIKELGLTLSKSTSRHYPTPTTTDADYADDLAIFADTIANATILLHNLERAASDVGLYVNASKTESAITTLSNHSLKSVQFV